MAAAMMVWRSWSKLTGALFLADDGSCQRGQHGGELLRGHVFWLRVLLKDGQQGGAHVILQGYARLVVHPKRSRLILCSTSLLLSSSPSTCARPRSAARCARACWNVARYCASNNILSAF